MNLIACLGKRVFNLWIAVQVELHGQYSFERMRAYNTFATTASRLRVVALCLLTPFPCLILITLIDSVPLAHPSEGTNANYVHWFRNYLTVVFISYAMLGQFPLSVPGLPLSFCRVSVTSFTAAIGGVGFQFIMSHVIGFPLPFSLVIGTPMWFAFICINFSYYFAAPLRANAKFRADLSNYFVVFIAQVSMTFVYPAYIYGFQSTDAQAQNVYVILLPIIKIALKNWMSRFLGSKDDMKPEIVIFNVEIFNALYVACSMQISSSITTTLVLSLVDSLQAWLSIRDVSVMLQDLQHLLQQIPPEHAWATKSFVDIALVIIDEDARVQTHPSLRSSCLSASTTTTTTTSNNNSVRPTNTLAPSLLSSGKRHNKVAVMPMVAARRKTPLQHLGPLVEETHDATRSSNDTSTLELTDANAKASSVSPAATTTTTTHSKRKDALKHTRTGVDVFTDAQRLAFVQKATQLLFTTEFVLLVEYTEVIVPIIYSIYVVAAYHLPNRAYYAQLATMDASELERTVSNIFIYAAFELASFFVMTALLQRKLQIASLRQLAFVLDQQGIMVQSKLVLWFFYAVQTSLTHFGADFSFQFAWFHRPPPHHAPVT